MSKQDKASHCTWLTWVLASLLVLLVALGVLAIGDSSFAKRSPWLTRLYWGLGIIRCKHALPQHPSSQRLRLLVDGAMALADSPDPQGTPQTLDAIVEPVGLTPAWSCCSHPEGRCINPSSVWAHPTWKALKFAPKHTHCRYAVERLSEGVGWRMLAVCDLDCDGVTGRFWRDLEKGDSQELVYSPLQTSGPDAELE